MKQSKELRVKRVQNYEMPLKMQKNLMEKRIMRIKKRKLVKP